MNTTATTSLLANMVSKVSEKKFRFDSFATEFACKEEKIEDVPDDDSGIDSEETQVSPPLTSSFDQQPLSLVLRKTVDSSKAGVVRHWKKFLKDQAVDMEDMEEEEEAENLSCKRIKQELPSPVTSVAHALLSLGRQEPPLPPQQKVFLPFQQQQPPYMQPLRPIPLPATPLRQLQPSDNILPQRRKPLQPSFHNQHPLPWPHLMRGHHQNSEPENLSVVKLPQHPSPLVKPNFSSFQTSSSSSAFLQLQSPTLSSTCHTSPLKEIQGNRIQPKPPLLPSCLPQQPLLPSLPILPPSSPPSPSENKFLHPAFQQSDNPKKQHNGQKPFSCLECKKSFSTQSGYAKHEQLHCNNQIQKSFSCKFCNKGYTSLSALKMHIRTHTLPCRCDVCGKSFSRPWLLQGHVRTHTGEKPFACSYCTRSFADKSNLRAHLQTHLQTKKYSCPGCQKTFSRMSLLNKHTDSGCQGLQSRNEECVQALVGMSTSAASTGGLIRT